MNARQQVLQLLGIARRADKIVSGEAQVLKQLPQRKLRLIFLATDVTPTAAKKINDKCQFYQVIVDRSFKRNELSQAIGMARSVVALTDEGFTKKALGLLKTNHDNRSTRENGE
ncbi:ribosomal L7Ae/L30e/S12e/Gadd45 family protein [Liquorilactobacillus sicerae]|uniref:ribosomal L7Ae/L30e/S12e/Gadd45 family protein n=1 Tax=Liquorilactobacillus sicerae TaxID=1416943 RepID=UPI0024807103|nr:ribosomal L7Ae/L30e/S12e/Gadd45 family protein [Liquorilactobacillus sicerae]